MSHARIDLPRRILLDSPAACLQAVAQADPFVADLDEVDVAQVWALVGLAALSRHNDPKASGVIFGGRSKAARFAHGLGFELVQRGEWSTAPGERGRTYKLARFEQFAEIEKAARSIAGLLLPTEPEEESRKTVMYVIVELLRNVLQHSGDRLGGVVAAQRMDEQQQYERPSIQVAVADHGVGIFEHLRRLHPDLATPQEALEKALRPHVSGTFEEGRSGSLDNAGMGLFFISEMAKLTAGRLLVATRGAALYLKGDPEGEGRHRVDILKPEGLGFPGTLVAFELPIEVVDHGALIQRINQLARERTPQRIVQGWLSWDSPPADVHPLLVKFVAEDTVKAREVALNQLEKKILERRPVALDFRDLDIALPADDEEPSTVRPHCTGVLIEQDVHGCAPGPVHGFDALRLAWARGVKIYVVNAKPAVRGGLELLESYALGG